MQCTKYDTCAFFFGGGGGGGGGGTGFKLCTYSNIEFVYAVIHMEVK